MYFFLTPKIWGILVIFVKAERGEEGGLLKYISNNGGMFQIGRVTKWFKTLNWNRKVVGSNPTKHSIKPENPTSLQESC